MIEYLLHYRNAHLKYRMSHFRHRDSHLREGGDPVLTSKWMTKCRSKMDSEEKSVPVSTIAISQKQTGFSLLETLVAFSILVLVLGVAFQVFAGGARAQRLASEYTEATTLARSILTMSRNGYSQEQGIAEERYHWQVTRFPFEPPELVLNQHERTFNAEKITVTVNWTSAGRDRKIQLDTIQLANHAE